VPRTCLPYARPLQFLSVELRVDRVAGAKFGACQLASGSRVSSHFHHTGEELFYRGTQGSGTIFFTCVYRKSDSAILMMKAAKDRL
jgi:uncharacterized Fe-S radical SAM superfamily protein PflX